MPCVKKRAQRDIRPSRSSRGAPTSFDIAASEAATNERKRNTSRSDHRRAYAGGNKNFQMKASQNGSTLTSQALP
jgi:hypothetical protein